MLPPVICTRGGHQGGMVPIGPVSEFLFDQSSPGGIGSLRVEYLWVGRYTPG